MPLPTSDDREPLRPPQMTVPAKDKKELSSSLAGGQTVVFKVKGKAEIEKAQ